MENEHENCENCGENHAANEVPFLLAATARLVIEKAMNMTLDPNNPLNQILVAGAGMLLESIDKGLLREQEIDINSLLVGGSDDD